MCEGKVWKLLQEKRPKLFQRLEKIVEALPDTEFSFFRMYMLSARWMFVMVGRIKPFPVKSH